MLSLRLIMSLFGFLTLAGCNEAAPFNKPVTPRSSVEPSLPSINSTDAVVSAPIKLGNMTDSQSISLMVDVVFAIDTSLTMNDEIAATRANMEKLIVALNASRLDARIHLLIDELFPLPASADPKKVAFVAQQVSSNDAISRLNSLFSGAFDSFYVSAQGQPLAAPIAFRSDARLEVVVISDDNGLGAGNLATDFDSSKTHKSYTFNSIVGLPTSAVGAACELAAVGTEYTTLSQKTGGAILDLCSPDWSVLITKLSSNIISRSVTFHLSKKPADVKNIRVILDGKTLAPDDYSYDAGKNDVSLLKTEAVKAGSKIILNYDAL